MRLQREAAQARLNRAGNRSARTQPARAAQTVLRLAAQHAKRTGQRPDDVLAQRRRAREAATATSRFVATPRNALATDRVASSANTTLAMQAQDVRRSSQTVSKQTAAAARAFEASRSRVVPYIRSELQPPRHVATGAMGVMTRGPTQHRLGGGNPNADHLRLMAPTTPRPPSKPFQLLHNPFGGGGFHNPVGGRRGL